MGWLLASLGARRGEVWSLVVGDGAILEVMYGK